MIKRSHVLKITTGVVLLFGVVVTFALVRLKTPSSAEEQTPNFPATAAVVVKLKDNSVPSGSLVSREAVTQKVVREKVQEVAGINVKVEPFVEFPAGSVEEQIQANKEKYPERAERTDENVSLPDFDLIARTYVPEDRADLIALKLMDQNDVEYAEVEEIPRPTSMPDDPFYLTTRSSSGGYMDSWALRKIGLNPTDDGNSDSGWDVTQGSSDVVVAVYGTGIDYTHPDLINNIWVNPGEDLDHDGVVWDTDDLDNQDNDGNGKVDDLIGWSFSKRSGNVYDDGSAYAGHDTQCAGIIGAVGNNSLGMPGVGWNVKLMGMQYGGYSEVIQYATDNGADVVSFSWTGSGMGLKSIADYAYANGTIVVFSSANNGTESILYDSSRSDHTWVVGATDQNDNRYSWSNYGNRLDFVAPGGNVLDTLPSDIKGSGLLTNYQTLSLSQNNNGDLALVYFDIENLALKYGLKSGGNWSFETIEEGSLSGFYPSLAFDGSNNPHVSYYDWDGTGLKYATKSGELWSIESLENGDDQGYFTSLAIGTNGYARIAYVDKTNNRVELMTDSASGWATETVGDVGSVSNTWSGVSLVLGVGDVPKVAYYRNSSGDLMYADKATGSWVITAVDTANAVGANPSLVLDSLGNPHVAYSDITNYDLRYAYYSGGWTTEALDTDNYVGYVSNSIEIADDGTIYIVTNRFSPNRVLVLQNSGEGWITEELGNDTVSLGVLSVAQLDDQGGLHFVSTSKKRGIYEGEYNSGWSLTKIAEWGNPYSILSGTSAATPMVAGLAALVISEHPDWNLDQVYWAVASSCNDVNAAGYDKYTGWGRINAKAALDIVTPLVDETPPTASITYPVDQSYVVPGSISITGTAYDDNFTYYNLFYKAHSSQTWSPLVGYGRTSKSAEELFSWNTLGFNGWYDLRLEVHDFYFSTVVDSTVFIGTGVYPTVTLESLSPDPTTDSTPRFSGTAASASFAIAAVEYQIDSTSGDWSACSPTDGAFNSASESYYCDVAELLDGAHTIYVKSRDDQGLETLSGNFGRDSFTVDATPPQAPSILIDAGAEVSLDLSLLLQLSATDATTGVSQMMISEDAGFAGAIWEIYVTSKTQTIPTGDGIRTLYVKFKDAVGNESETATDSVFVDSHSPGLEVGPIPTDFPKTINGTATDAATIVSVEFRINSDAWALCTATDGAFDSSSEEFAFQISELPEGVYRVSIRATDEYGNVTASSGYYLYDFFVDYTAPASGSVLVQNNSTYALARAVTLSLFAVDPVSGVSGIMVSEDPSFSGAVWHAYSSSYPWTLSGGDGAKTVYVKFKDRADNESDTYSDAISLDVEAPGIWLGTCSGWQTAARFNIQGVAADSGSLVSTIQYNWGSRGWKTAGSTDGGFGESAEGYYISRRGLAQGSYSVSFRAVDKNGHISNTVTCPFGVDTARPYVSIYRGQKYLRRSSSYYIKGLAKDSRSGVSRVIYKIDRGSWNEARAVDGSFNSTREQFLMSIYGLGRGWHRAYMMVYDNAGNRMKTYSYSFYMR